MMPKPLPTPEVHRADLLVEVLALRPEVERILRGDSRHADTGSVDDKMQIVLLNVTRHLGDYQPHADGMRPWLSRIAQNVQRDAARGARRGRRIFGYKGVAADEVIDDAACTERRAAARALLRKVVTVMADMPEQLRTVLVLVAFGRLDHEQVAAELAISIPAVKMRLLRAREYLREHAGTLDDHLAVLAPLFTLERQTGAGHRFIQFGGRFGPFLPPMLAAVFAWWHVELAPVWTLQPTIAEPIRNGLRTTALVTSSLPLDSHTAHTVLTVQSMRETSTPLAPPRSDPPPRIRIDLKPPSKTLAWRKTR